MIVVQVDVQVEAVKQGNAIVTTEVDRYNIGSMVTLASHTSLSLHSYVRVREKGGMRAEVAD